jgi:hypothetical protein
MRQQCGARHILQGGSESAARDDESPARRLMASRERPGSYEPLEESADADDRSFRDDDERLRGDGGAQKREPADPSAGRIQDRLP